ncbi:MAG: response regulator [Proteobacteria bacterium]|nr:response regulator [Pseudomonadota bacterium]
MRKKILIVEDEEKIARVLQEYLEKSDYDVSCLNNGSLVVSHMKKQAPDLILLDVMLPGMDGMEVCKEVRKISTVPIIMVTARVEEVDRLIGLELGADDYICKPFSPREVVARVKSVLRRTQPENQTSLLAVGSVVLDVNTHRVKIDGGDLELTPSEFGLLKVMMSQPNRVFSRNELLNQVQGYEFEGYDRTIDTHIKNLRRKLAKFLPGKEIIKAVYGTGYRYNDPFEDKR